MTRGVLVLLTIAVSACAARAAPPPERFIVTVAPHVPDEQVMCFAILGRADKPCATLGALRRFAAGIVPGD